MRPRQRPLKRRWTTRLNTRQGLGILQRSGGRGDPSESGSGKIFVDSFCQQNPEGAAGDFEA